MLISAHKLKRAGQWKISAQPVFGRNQKVQMSLKHHIHLLSIKVLRCLTTTEFTKYALSTGLWARTQSDRFVQGCTYQHWGVRGWQHSESGPPAASTAGQWESQQRWPRSHGKISHWPEREEISQWSKQLLPHSLCQQFLGAGGQKGPYPLVNLHGLPRLQQTPMAATSIQSLFSALRRQSLQSLVHFCLLPRDPSTPASIPFPLLNVCTCINIAEEIIEATGPIIGGTAQSFEHTQPLGT